MTQVKRSARPRAVPLADRVQRAVDGGVDRAEKIHKRVASLPLEVMEQLHLFQATVKEVQKIQDRSIGAAYDVVRGINRDVIRLAKKTLRSQRGKAKAQPGKKAESKEPTGATAAHEAA
jgi:hypothetical protein